MALGGLAVSRGEPDLQIGYGHESVGIAAKRLDSVTRAQVRRNIKSAAVQIERSGLRGWVAVNMDNRFHGLPVFGKRRTLLRRFSDAFDWVSHIAAESAAGSEVLGVMAYAHLSDWRPVNSRRSVPALMVRVPFRWTLWDRDNPAARMFFEDFSDAWRPRVDEAIRAVMEGRITDIT